MISRCKLCLQSRELRSSHLLPAAFYTRLRSHDGGVVRIDTQRRTIIATDRQYQTSLLCDDCEHRLKVGGEDTAIGLSMGNDGTFPLADHTYPLASGCPLN